MNFNNIPPVTKYLLIINIVVFVFTEFILPSQGIDIKNLFAAHLPFTADFRAYQIVTSMFIHYGIGHIFMNMYGLYMFGSMIERFFGQQKYIILYFLAGFGSYFLNTGVDYFQFGEYLNLIANGQQNLIHPNDLHYLTIKQSAGASGALFGVVASFAVVNPTAPLGIMFLPFQFKALQFLYWVVGISIVLGVLQFLNVNLGFLGGIGHFAHVGGAIVGFFLTKYWMNNRYRIN